MLLHNYQYDKISRGQEQHSVKFKLNTIPTTALKEAVNNTAQCVGYTVTRYSICYLEDRSAV
jgi:hypothetical protein